MVTVGNVNHALSIVGHWIFEYNYKKSLPLTLESFNVIFSPLVGEGLISRFETIFLQSDTSTTQRK